MFNVSLVLFFFFFFLDKQGVHYKWCFSGSDPYFAPAEQRSEDTFFNHVTTSSGLMLEAVCVSVAPNV